MSLRLIVSLSRRLVVSSSRRLVVSLSRHLVVLLSRRITWVFLEAQLTTPNVILKAADYITAYLPIAAPIPYENPLDYVNVFNCRYQNDIFVRAAMGDLQYILYT